jgi:hypothetical protein
MKILILIVGLGMAAAGAGCSGNAQGNAEGQKKVANADVPAGAEASKPAAPTTSSDPAPVAPRPAYRDVVVRAGTTLTVELDSAVASDSSSVEDPVRATLQRSIVVDGVTALPTGTSITGHVTEATRSARVKGRARVAFRFTRLDPPGDGERLTIRTGTIAREAEATKKQDAVKIGGGAAGGAIIGGIVGGGDGAAKGAAIGGAAGTGVVLATRGKEVRLPAGTKVTVKLLEPLTVRVKS